MADENGKKTVEEWGKELEGLAEEEKWEEMLSASEVCVKEHPEEAVGYFYMGIAEDELGNSEEAIAEYDEALELETKDKKKALIHNNRGNVLKKLKRYEEAIADYGKAIKLSPEYLDAYNGRGNTFNDLQRYEEAIADFNRAIELNSKDPLPYIGRGVAYATLKKYEEAFADFNEAIALCKKLLLANPQDTEALTLKIMAEKNKTIAELQREGQKNLEEVKDELKDIRPAVIVERYKQRIDDIERELHGTSVKRKVTSDADNASSESEATRSWFDNYLFKYIRIHGALSVLLLAAAIFTFFIEPPSCYEPTISPCMIRNMFYSHWLWIVLAGIYMVIRMSDRDDIGLIKKSQNIAANLLITFIIVFLVMSEVYFGIFDISFLNLKRPDDDFNPNDVFNMARYTAAVFFIIAPFIFYYRHIQNRANHLHILVLALERELNNILFWIVQKGENANSSQTVLATQILDHTNKNGAADIVVRMLHPKFHEGRRLSLFGHGGNALSELEDKLEDLTDVIKRLELREPKQDEDKQKTKGNDTDVGATTDNK